MSIAEIDSLVRALPMPGSVNHGRVAELIEREIARGRLQIGVYIQDDDGYWGHSSNIRYCESGLKRDERDPNSWVRLKKGERGRKTFRPLQLVRMRWRITDANTHPTGGTTMAFGGFNYVVLDRAWCQSMVESGSFQCAGDQRRYCHLNAMWSPIDVEGRTMCYDTAQFYFWESDERFHMTPEDRSRRAPAPQSAWQLPAWHTQRRPWEGSRPKTMMYGCELEIYSNQDRKLTFDTARNLGLQAEHDGSLDRNHGIEIIGVPGTLAYHQDPNGPWLKFLAEMNVRDFTPEGKKEPIKRAYGYDAPQGEDTHGRPATYGMHVSLNRLAMTKEHQARFIAFINENATECEGIAGRPRTDTAGFILKHREEILADVERTDDRDKYWAVAIRGEQRLEVRIFRSTIYPKGFLKNVEFCASAAEFTKESESDKWSEYIKWFRKNHELYPNLHARLFPAKKGKASS